MPPLVATAGVEVELVLRVGVLARALDVVVGRAVVRVAQLVLDVL